MIRKSSGRLASQLKRFESSFLKLQCETAFHRRPEKWYFLEGLLSQSWQAWNAYCRAYCCQFAQGYTFESGTIISAQPWAQNLNQARYNLTRVAANKQVHVNFTGSFAERHEVTWGDIDKLGDIFRYFGSVELRAIAAFPEFQSLKSMQNLRNCCAHITNENRLLLTNIATQFVGHSFIHPTDLLSWVEPTSNDFVFIKWMQDIEIVSEYMVAI